MNLKTTCRNTPRLLKGYISGITVADHVNTILIFLRSIG